MKEIKKEKYSAPRVERKCVKVENNFAASLKSTSLTATIDTWNYDKESSSGTTIDGWDNEGSLN
jgi:hypothetical protein